MVELYRFLKSFDSSSIFKSIEEFAYAHVKKFHKNFRYIVNQSPPPENFPI